MQEEIQVKKPTWTNPFNKEIFSDETEIAYYKSVLEEEICSSLLLGSFSDDGNYSVSKDILVELVDVNKYIEEVVEGTYHLTAKIKSDQSFSLKFTLSFQIDNEAKKKTALLKVVENFKNMDGSFVIPITTTVARYKDDDDIYFLQKVAKVFHIYDKRNGEGREEENDEIILKIKELLAKYKTYKNSFAETNEHLSSFYIDNILASLKSHPCKFSEFILRKYQLILEANKNLFGKPSFYRKIRFELDKLISENIKLCDNEMLSKVLIQHKAEFLSAKKGFDEALLKSAEKKAEKKADAKKAAAKAQSDSKSGGKAKAKAKAKAKSATEEAKKADQFFDYSKMEKQTLHFETKPVQIERKIILPKTQKQETNNALKDACIMSILNFSNQIKDIVSSTLSAQESVLKNANDKITEQPKINKVLSNNSFEQTFG